MASAGAWAPIAVRILRHTFQKTSSLLRNRLADVSCPHIGEAQALLVRNPPRYSIHPIARLRQNKGRWYATYSTINTAVRQFMSTGSASSVRYNRAAFPSSATATAVSRLTARTPFALTLRPNLTGGALPRTSGGYSLGGWRSNGARYFSHTPAAPAQVVNNVSAAVRAFCLSGQRAQFDGLTSTGEKRFRTVTARQDAGMRKVLSAAANAPGSYIDFNINPTLTALSPFGAVLPFGGIVEQLPQTLNTEGFLDVLSVDFSRALKDFAATMNDLNRLRTLGDLPITLPSKSIIRVRFPGCDSETVARLCDEVGVQRCIVSEDLDFNIETGCYVALKFPFAPGSEHSLTSPGGSLRSQSGHAYEECVGQKFDNLWLEGYESMEEDESGSEYLTKSKVIRNSDFEGLEGIYRFLEQCDNLK